MLTLSPTTTADKTNSDSDEPPRGVGLEYYTALSNTINTLISESQRRVSKLEELYYNESTTPFQLTSTSTQYPTSSTQVLVTTHNGCWGGGGTTGPSEARMCRRTSDEKRSDEPRGARMRTERI